MADLVRYDSMCRAIAECHSVDEVADLHNKARALEMYAKQAQNVEAERKATEIRLRAERRAGELMRSLRREPGKRTDIEPAATAAGGSANENTTTGLDENFSGVDVPRSEYRQALDSAGIPERTAQRWQGLASVPAEQFERHLSDRETKPTTNGILRAANGAQRMDNGSLWVWGRLRDFEREGHLNRDAAEVFAGMTETMQADVRRVLPSLLDWLTDLERATA